ncbi:hypothetical protein [Leucothrix mucor]|nr:hypothetical protein [Leucothrix mucor]
MSSRPLHGAVIETPEDPGVQDEIGNKSGLYVLSAQSDDAIATR